MFLRAQTASLQRGPWFSSFLGSRRGHVHHQAHASGVEHPGDRPMGLPNEHGQPFRLARGSLEAYRPKLTEAVFEDSVHFAFAQEEGKVRNVEMVEVQWSIKKGIALWP